MQNILVTLKMFYNIDKVSFKDITTEKLTNIIERAKEIHNLYLNEEFRVKKSERYLRIMELINSNYRKDIRVNNHYSSTSQSEKYLLFMFSIDPEFEIAIIHASEDRTDDIKNKIREKFGVYDPYLIIIEKAVIKKLLDSEKQSVIYEEIEKRAFK